MAVIENVIEKVQHREALKKRQASPSLLALTGSALALPNLPTVSDVAEAATMPERSLALQVSRYSEMDLSGSDLHTLPGADIGGVTERYSIPVLMLNATLPKSERLAYTVNLSYERMSGASPWYITPKVNDSANIVLDDEGRPVPVVRMTGATIEDQRTDFSLTTHYYLPDARIDATGRFSIEDDYRALSAGLGVALDFNDQLTTVEGSMSVSSDTIEAVEPGTFQDRPQDKEYKGTFSLYGGITQVMNRVSTLQTGLGFKVHSGYLTDAYKQVAFYDDDSATPSSPITWAHENRPTDRHQTTWVLRYRRYSEAWRGTFHTDYRFYHDNWGVNSHTFDTAWYRDLGATMQLVPSIRLYLQSEADFYQAIYDGVEADFEHYSSDYRLSSYGAITLRLKLIKRFGTSTLTAEFEHYNSDDSLGIGGGEGNPALVDFNIVSFGYESLF